MVDHDPVDLKYFLSEKSGILIVSLIGPLDRSNGAVLEKALEEIASRNVQWLILNFHDVISIDRTAVAPLSRLRKHARDKGISFKVCFLSPQIRSVLSAQGITDSTCVFNNLADALKTIRLKTGSAAA